MGSRRLLGLGLTSQEAVQLHEELEVRIVALGRLAVGVAHVVAVEIDTYKETKVSSSAFGSSMLREVCGSTRGAEVCYDLCPLNPNSSLGGELAAPSYSQRPFPIVHLHTKARKKFSLTYPS